MEYSEFYEKYAKEHACCPRCHSRDYNITLVGYIYDPEHPENYKDGNSVRCHTCGWRGIKHDMVPEPEKMYWTLVCTNYKENTMTQEEARNLATRLTELCKDEKVYFYAVKKENY